MHKYERFLTPDQRAKVTNKAASAYYADPENKDKAATAIITLLEGQVHSNHPPILNPDLYATIVDYWTTSTFTAPTPTNIGNNDNNDNDNNDNNNTDTDNTNPANDKETTDVNENNDN